MGASYSISSSGVEAGDCAEVTFSIRKLCLGCQCQLRTKLVALIAALRTSTFEQLLMAVCVCSHPTTTASPSSGSYVGMFLQTSAGYPTLVSGPTLYSGNCGSTGTTCSSMTNPDVLCTDIGLSLENTDVTIKVNGLTTSNCGSVSVRHCDCALACACDLPCACACLIQFVQF